MNISEKIVVVLWARIKEPQTLTFFYMVEK